MKLFVIYGPPAAGKLTIGQRLSQQTGIKLFHNHISIDVAKQFFDRGTPGFDTIVYTLRKTVFEEAAKANLDLIFTVVYFYPHENPEMQWMIEAIESNGGNVEFIQLTCPKETLFKRIANESRMAYKKILSADVLEGVLQHNLYTPYPKRSSLCIDTSTQTPEQTTQQIIKHFNLTTLEAQSS
jgi:shikimate kinase